MSKYDINIAKLAIQLLPMCLRGNKMKAFVKAITEPLKYMKEYFEAFRKSKDYRLTHNSQVCYLQAALNDRFDPLLRGIEILDGDDHNEGVILHKRSENEPLVIDERQEEKPVIMYQRNFGGSRAITFKVKVPRRLSLNNRLSEYEVSAVVNEYKLASMRYEIIL